jgi:hypothetical protein
MITPSADDVLHRRLPRTVDSGGGRLGIALQQVSPHTTLLIFALIVGLGLLTATPAMVRSPDANSKP